jgi:hypothetical protein
LAVPIRILVVVPAATFHGARFVLMPHPNRFGQGMQESYERAARAGDECLARR